MPPQFLGNPLEFWDSDLEPNGEEEWVTLPTDTVVMEIVPRNIAIDIIQSDDDTVWLDEDDDFTDYNSNPHDSPDEDYNPDDDYNDVYDFNDDYDYNSNHDSEADDEIFEETQDINVLHELYDESQMPDICDLYTNYGVDENDYQSFDIDDYVTYEDMPSPNPSILSDSIKSAAETNFIDVTEDTDTD
ncbi:trigger factor-like [Diorhabda sublineata]|uniref:trigger factor-like n=1 Tax=Diorhabda sublineata TaxID=1163346 RepID=UPI0024E06294|nr:trigger factor-like [Diorhabda sublineata]